MLLASPLPRPARLAIWKAASTILPPVFYLAATERERVKEWWRRVRGLGGGEARIHPITIEVQPKESKPGQAEMSMERTAKIVIP